MPRLKINRHGVYGIRVYWRDELGKLRESLHSLGTKDGHIARVVALQFSLSFEQKRHMSKKPLFPNIDELTNKYELDMSRGVMKADGKDDHALMMQAVEAYYKMHGVHPQGSEALAYGKTVFSFTPPQTRQVLKSMLFSEATEAYLEEKKLDNVEQTIVDKRRTYKDFMAIFGDLEINLINKPEIVQWKTADLKRDLKAHSINSRLGEMNDFFKWAINNGHYTAHPTSPVDGLRISSKSKLASKTEHYEPFDNDELKKIFAVGYLKKMKKPDFYWMPLVAMYSGARREEVAALLAADVKAVDGIPSFFIQKGKNAAARRLVPLHPTLIEMGFLDYANMVQSLGFTNLFPHLKPSANGLGKNAGRQFSNWLSDCNIEDSRKVFHSFRHTAITRLHATEANVAHVKQISGHQDETKGVHFQTYTHDVGLAALQKTLNRLEYPIDLKPLQLKDPTFKGFLQRLKATQARNRAEAKLMTAKPKTKTVTKG